MSYDVVLNCWYGEGTFKTRH